MGNSSSCKEMHKNFGQIYLQTDKPYYTSGENVTGRIFINLHNNFNASSLYLKIKGSENCKFPIKIKKDRLEDQTNENSYEMKYGKNIFF